MRHRAKVALAAAVAALLATPGCGVMRGQESAGAYVDDATSTTQVKTRIVENKQVAAASIQVGTLDGAVMLSGLSKSDVEKRAAGDIARMVKGVRSVRNPIAIRP